MILQLFLILYRLLWALLLPVVLAYLWWRGRRDPLYARHMAERFGRYDRPLPQGGTWLHAVSLGETRSALALVRLMLDRGERVIITNFTPTGRREAERQFAADIAAGQLAVVWAPFDMGWTYRRFFRATRPKIGLTLEVEVWPGMIFAARRAGVPLYMCNGQYATGPLARDSGGLRLRQKVMRGLTGAFVKSDLQAARFHSIGLHNTVVTGELRFDQPVPPALTDAARTLRDELLAPWPEVIAIASGVEGEEQIYIDLIIRLRRDATARGVTPPLFVYVPRAPERFDTVADGLAAAGLPVARRSAVLDAGLQPVARLSPDTAVLLGDSLGEMFFYLGLSDRVIVGGGFTPRAAHNIIEPLMLGKTVLTGPQVWTIEYPFVEAQAAGVAQSVDTPEALLTALQQPMTDMQPRIEAFLHDHAGASRRTLEAIDAALR
ncbi:MAG: glycosyltransferase N-terminal domain-containing protein [Paracoccaceae bacterium]